MVSVRLVLLFLTICTGFIKSQDRIKVEHTIRKLVVQWSPLIWLSPEELYYPMSADQFLRNVYVADESGHLVYRSVNETTQKVDTKSLFLYTRSNLSKNASSFLNGHNPKTQPVKLYAIISLCRLGESQDLKPHFHVTYWAFYPYNRGKNICFIGKVPSLTIFGRCLGRLKTIGSHVGDWEHVTLIFRGKPYPSEMFLSVHDTGGFYKYDPQRKHFKIDERRKKQQKFPPIVRLQSEHPVLFAAEGSHGFWSAPGEHQYVKLPKLTDSCGYGVPWKSWEHLEMFIQGVDDVPMWMYFKGKWGNPTSNCVLSKKLGLCEHTDGPPGILMQRKQEFYC